MSGVPTPSHTPARPASTNSLRAVLLARGKTGDAWSILPQALPVLRQSPGDVELSLLVATKFADLGLRTLASEVLQAAALVQGGDAGKDAALASVRERIAGLPDDRLSLERRKDILSRNLDSLATRAQRAIDLRSMVESWHETAESEECFVARDGNVIRRKKCRAVTRVIDEVSLARRAFVPPASDAPASSAQPVYVEGLDPPWLARWVYESTQTRADGLRTRVVIVEADVVSALRGLSVVDLAVMLADDRVVMFVGDRAGEALDAWLRDRFDTALGERVITAPGSGVRATCGSLQGVAAILGAARQAQQAELNSSHDAARVIDTRRDDAWWAERYSAGAHDPLRILILTSRLTTYTQHSSRDLAECFRRLGHEARVLIEPDDASLLTSNAHWRQHAEWRPDLVLSINNTRSMLGGVMPAGVPMVTWIQDKVAAMFQAATGGAMGTRDFLVGHLHPELFDTFGFPRERCLYSPVLASEVKFHDGPIDESRRSRYECEVAYVSHHAETPSALAERLVAMSPEGFRTLLFAMMSDLMPEIERVIGAPIREEMTTSLRRASREICDRHAGARADEAMRSAIFNNYAAPIAERALRHQMLEWARELCEERSWRLHLYGNNWDRHSTLGRFAKGPLAHDEDLRAAYQAARVHLHAGLGGLQHQRVMECALSGGLVLLRIKREDLNEIEWWAQETIRATPGVRIEHFSCRFPGKHAWAPIADHVPAMLNQRVRDRVGLPRGPIEPQCLYVTHIEPGTHWVSRFGQTLSYDASWYVGDPSETGFWSRESFRENVARAVESEGHRAGWSRWQRRCTRSAFSFDAFAREVVDLVGRTLRANASCSSSKAHTE
ncbi:MAG: hypothetical protein AB7Q00_01035 [Phycisphaerales bacterium]